MFTFIIISIFFLSAATIFVAYYKYVAHFHRIQLFGRKIKKKHSRTDFPQEFNPNDIFVRKDDLRMLQILKVRKLPVVVCLGDSITHGVVSTNYVELLQEKYSGQFLFVNSGINGNLAYNLKTRLKHDCIDLDPDFITILIGTNDVNSQKDAKTLNRYMLFQKLPCKPDFEFYKSNLTEIIETLQAATKARIAILSLPVIGENLNSKLNQLAVKYSTYIKELTVKYKITYLELNEKQHRFLTENRTRTSHNSRKKNMLLNFLLMMGRSFDRIAEIKNQLLTYDDLHETSQGAALIVNLIAGWIEKNK